MKKSNLLLITPAIVLGLAAAGCGGGSATSGYPNQVSTKVAAPVGPGFDGGTAMLLLQGGYTWHYAVAGTITRDYYDAGGVKRTLSGAISQGDMVRTVANVTFNGSPAFKVTDTYTVTPQGNVPEVWVQTQYLTQAGDGSLSVVGTNDQSVDFVWTTPMNTLPGTFALTNNLGGSTTILSQAMTTGGVPAVDLSSNPIYWAKNDLTDSFTVLGTESVPSSTGAPYTTWKTQSSGSEHATFNALEFLNEGQFLKIGFVVESTRSTSSIDNWVPALGAPVKSHVTYASTDTVLKTYSFSGNTMTYTSDTFRTVRDLNLSMQNRSGF